MPNVCSLACLLGFFFFSLLPPARNKRGGEGLLYMCVELVGEKLPPHSMCGSLIFDR